MANDHRQALNGAEVFIRALENEGVKYIFAVPGEGESRLPGSVTQFQYPPGAEPA